MKVSTLLEAGAIVPVDAAAPEGMALDTVSARTYRSPILGDRPIVRLTLDSLAPGDDLAMEFLGLGAPEVTDPLGLQRRRALGFPGWALVNDPEHAGFALEVVKELKKHARRAASKPGHAKEGLDDIGDRLGRSVPHFLPSYYEEVGRIFIETGNVKYGAQAFNKAREAENVHALEVDESLRLETFLEFALSGALAVKSLSSYAKELSKGYDPLTAYTHFRTLCVRRTLGGIPPWAAMGKELRRLLKGTGLKVQEEEEKLVEEILGASCLTKAPNAFWKHYQKALTALCRRSAEARGTLLNLFPSAPVNYGSTNEGHVSFFEILSDSGALEALYAEDASTIDAQAGPKGGAAAWLQKALNTFKEWPWYTEKNPAPYPLFEVIEKMAPRLLSDGVEVEPWRPGRQTWQRTGINIEATDLLLELGVPVADPPEKSEANLANWTKLTLRKPAEHRRDLHHLAQDPRFDDLLAASLDGQFGHAEFEEAAKGVAGLADARRKWVEAKVATLTESALVNFESTVERVCNAKAGITTEEFPNLYTRIGACNVAEVLARTWSLGVPDELGWPELDETCEALEGEVTASGAFPYLVVANKARAVVLGPEGEEARFELKVPAKAEVKTLRYIDGQLFVAYQEGWERSFYWSGSPEVIGDYPHYFWDKNHSANALGLAVTGGGTTESGRVFRPGDSAPPTFCGLVFTDGDTFWRRNWDGLSYGMKEFDPARGEDIRSSFPAFFEDFATEGKEINLQSCALHPIPKALSNSPLGPRGGFYGWRVRTSKKGVECEGIDGRTIEAKWNTQILGLLTWPGGGGVAITSEPHPPTMQFRDPSCELVLAQLPRHAVHSNAPPLLARGQAVSLPHHWLHFFTPRDISSSEALRKVTKAQVEEVLVAAREAVGAANKAGVNLKDIDSEALIPVLNTAMPEVEHPRILRGLAGQAIFAAHLEDRLAQHFSASTSADPLTAMREFLHNGQQNTPLTPLDQGHYISRTYQALAMSGAHAWAAAMGGASEEAKRVAHIEAVVLEGIDAPIRAISGQYTGAPPFQPREKATTEAYGVCHGGNRYLVTLYINWNSIVQYSALEVAASGDFKALPGTTITNAFHRGWSGSYARVLELVTERGPVPIDASIGERIAKDTGLEPNAAALLWIGCPNIGSYEKNFMPKETRTALKWKVADGDAARKSIKASLDNLQRQTIYDLAMPADPQDLWDRPDEVADRLSKAVVSTIGRVVSVDSAILQDASRRFDSWRMKTAELLPLLINSAGSRFARDARYFVVASQGRLISSFQLASSAEDCLTGRDLAAAANIISYLYATLPVGDSLRKLVPAYRRLVLDRLENPEMLVTVNQGWYGEDSPAQTRAVVEKYVSAYPGQSIALPTKEDPEVLIQREGIIAVDTGTFIACGSYDPTGESKSGRTFLGLRLKALFDEDFSIEVSENNEGADAINAARLIISPGFEAMVQRIAETPVPEGQYEANPLHGAPDLVSAVEEHLALSQDAAVAYLQTLALMEPTTKNLRLWNGWSAARLKKALAPLVEKGLLLEAKRARAGRSHFLPGAWQKESTPRLPYEAWKRPLYGLKVGLENPLAAHLPLKPFHEVFADAWQRVLSGDKPEYEEV